MKNNFKLWAMALLAGGMMASCSTEDVTGSGTSEENTPRYLAVNIVSTGTAGGTRAYPDNSYETGSDAENAVKNMRFYLFNQDGSAYKVADGSSYVTGKYEAIGDDKTSETVEEVGNAVLVIDQTTAALPAYIVAVLNSPTLADTYSLTELKAVTGSYVPANLANDGIVMTNSVWNNNTTCGEVSVAGKVADSEDAAKKNPVEVYVERVVAKVEVTDGRTTATPAAGLFEVGTDTDGQPIYARIEGWQVADYNKASYLVKTINSTWTDATLGITPWSTADYHRSFWATSVPFGENNVIGNDKSWNTIDANALGTPVYTLENTPTAVVKDLKVNDLTKVIVAATLVKKNGTDYEPVTILKYMGVQYTVNNALTAILAKVNAGSEYFSDQTGTPVAVGDIHFVAGTNPYNAQAATAEGKIIYKRTVTDGAATYTVATDAFNALLAAEQVLYWTGGKTYYYTTIGHLGTAGNLGEYGVVRNHIYRIGINSIKGLGTPVYDPTKPIDPTTPPEEHSYLAARVNILAWKIVNKDVELR